MSESIRELCVVHLVRAFNGIEPFRRFLESYRDNHGGIEHDLLIVFKGFGSQQSSSEYRDLLVPFQHTTLEVSDEGFDITAYLTAFNRYSEHYHYFCFLNSYSVILDRNWLKKLYENISKQEVGLAGATGSWESHRGSLPTWILPFAIALGHYRLNQDKCILQMMMNVINATWRQLIFQLKSDRFPSYHVRTNAFITSSDLMKKIKFPVIKSKLDAYRIENGKNSLTNQVLELGKKVLVVGKDGIGYEKEMWHKSNTFRQANQENLLIADNQTRHYTDGNTQIRRKLSLKAWGVDFSCGSNK